MTGGVVLHLFDTAIGRCAIAWTAAGLKGAALPSSSEEELRRHLRGRFPDAVETAPSGAAADAVQGVVALLAHGRGDLRSLPLDSAGTPAFDMRVYDLIREVPPGQAATYGDLARRLGDVTLSRRVGQALGRNPWPIVVPCHRVLGEGGKVGGFSAPGGVVTKMRLLELERAAAGPGDGLFADLPLAIAPAGQRRRSSGWTMS